MRRLLLVSALGLTLGCGGYIGTVATKSTGLPSDPLQPQQVTTSEGECKGIGLWLGQAAIENCGSGGPVSIPGATLIGTTLKALRSLLPGAGTTEPAVVNVNVDNEPTRSRRVR